MAFQTILKERFGREQISQDHSTYYRQQLILYAFKYSFELFYIYHLLYHHHLVSLMMKINKLVVFLGIILIRDVDTGTDKHIILSKRGLEDKR